MSDKIKMIDSSELVKDTATTYNHNRLVHLRKKNFVVQDGKQLSATVSVTNGKKTIQSRLD